MATVEHEILRFFAERGEAPARDAVQAFQETRGISRGAVVKMMDRLYKKGLLKRRVENHVFHYSPSEPIENIEAGYVGQFVQTRLQGSLTPLLTFLGESDELHPDELAAVHKIAERLERSSQ